MNLKNFPKRLDSKTSSLRIAVPENLDLALEGLIRKVLREQPKTDDIYAFAADYFETLLKIRDKAGAKVTAAQLCPFHNDEDAHEMIKLAGTFTKPKPKNDERGKMKAPAKKKEPERINKRTKPKEKAKDKQPAKQVTPDLIKKLPTVTKPDAEVDGKTQTQGHESEEATPGKEEEFLTSDPIKELVEKELMMEAGGNKTDGNDKTGNQNAQGEEKPLEKDKREEREENEGINTVKEKTEEAENEKTQTELSKTSEDGMKEAEESEKAAEDVKAESENSTKGEDDNKEVMKPEEEKTGETQKETEDVIKQEEKVEQPSEIVTELEQTQKETEGDVIKEEEKVKKPLEIVTQLEETQKKTEGDVIKEEEKVKKPLEIASELGETQKKTEEGGDVIQEVEKLVTEAAKTVEVQRNEKKEGSKPHKEVNKKMETFPVSESGKKVTDVLPSEKLPEISEDVTEKSPDATQTEQERQQETGNAGTSPTETKPQDGQPEQQPDNSQITTETKDKQQPNTKIHLHTEAVTKPVQETLASIPEQVSLELSLDGAAEPETDITSTEAKTEEATPVNAQPTGDNEQTDTGNQEKEAEMEKETEEQKKNSEDEKPKETTAEEPKSEQTVAVNEDKTFGEIIKDNEEEEKTEEIKSNEAEKPGETAEEEKIPGEVTKAEENEKPQESTTVDDSDKATETTTEENIKPTEEAEDKTPDIGESGTTEVKNERPNTEDNRELDDQETQTKTSTKTADDMLEPPQAQPETKETPEEKTEEPKTTETEVPGDELCSVVDNKEVPKDDEMTIEEEPQPAAEGIQTGQKQEVIETKEAEEPCTLVDVPKEGETVQESKDEVENMQTEEELCRVVDNPRLDVTDEGKTQETEKEEVRPEMTDEGKTQETEKEEVRPEMTDEGKTQETVKEEVRPDMKDEGETQETEKEEVKPEMTDEGKTQETEKEEVKPQIKEESNNAPAEDNTGSSTPNETTPDSGKGQESTTEPTQTDTQHIIRVEEVEIPTKPDEIQIKTIQTHYYDTLQVPETVTREYRVHNLPTAGLLEAANFLQPNKLDENMNSTPEQIISPPGEENTPAVTPEQVDAPAPVLPLDLETPKTDSDDLLDLMTPTSGYSMNLSEVSLLTVSELFLDSEKRYSSLEKEEIRYVTPKTETTNGRQEVEEVIEKTVLPSNIAAVPVPPRDAEEINQEANVQTTGNVKEEDKPEEKPENDSTEGSSNGRSVDSDIPFISVEVKTVIETLDDEEEEKNGGRPEVEVKVRATIDVQDDVDLSQVEGIPVEDGNVTSDGKSQETPEERPSEEDQTRDQDEERQGVFSGGVEGSSSLDSDITASSAATEIKRTDSSNRNLSSVRSLVSTQSLDLEKRNPLLKTRSLSNFRHGVTDFEVWNKIEKELEDAAIKIQSKFRGYKTRKKLQRENAVQITTEESSVSTTPVEAEPKDETQQQPQQQQQQSTGEFHDSIILSEHPR